MSKLKWPSARPFLEKALQQRPAYLAFLAHADKADPALISFLKQPDYFCRYISAEHSDLQVLVLEKALSTGSPISLYIADNTTRKTIQALIASSDPLQCALGMWVYAHETTITFPDISAKLTHPDPWVRRAAVVAVIQRTRTQEKGLTQLLRLIGDPSEDVIFAVVAGLLPDRIRQAEPIAHEIDQFKYEKIRIPSERQYFMYGRQRSTRPFYYMTDRPAWFDSFRKSTDTNRFHDDQVANLTALLYAVYGDFTLLSHRLESAETLTPIQLIAISLCRDDRYVAMLEKMVRAEPDSTEMEGILNATRHWTGEGVRDLRRLINRLFRKMG